MGTPVPAETRPRSAAPYRDLVLRLAPGSGGVRTLLVASCRTSAGTPSEAVRIAEALARAGSRTLLADCDLATPRLQETTAIGDGPGTADAFAPGGMDVAASVVGAEEDLDVLGAGTRVARVEVMGGPRDWSTAIQRLAAGYDAVVLLGPPLLEGGEAVRIGDAADGCVLLVEKGRTSKRDLARAVASLSDAGVSLAGVVIVS